MNKSILYSVMVSSILFMGCKDKNHGAHSTVSNINPDARITDSWTGKWYGPEGTFIEIKGSAGLYRITIQDLDGPKEFQGTGAGNRISFERNGTTEIIQAGTGAETGMKWLAEKSDCLWVSLGEGWCRD